MLKNISKSRRRFRIILLSLCGVSFIFCAAMITLRANKSLHWYMVRYYQNEIFAIDTYAHQLRAEFQNDDDNHQTAMSLIQKGFFSNTYGQAGVIMLKELADEGHPASQIAFGDMLMRSPQLPDHKNQAYKYYAMAAAQNSVIAKERLKIAKLPSQ